MKDSMVLLDPTAETAPTQRARIAPLASLNGKTIALLDIGKARGDVFLDQLEVGMVSRGLKVKRYAKPTNTKVAPVAVAQAIATECDVVVEALSD
jgi:hypothetical protein